MKLIEPIDLASLVTHFNVGHDNRSEPRINSLLRTLEKLFTPGHQLVKDIRSLEFIKQGQLRKKYTSQVVLELPPEKEEELSNYQDFHNPTNKPFYGEKQPVIPETRNSKKKAKNFFQKSEEEL